jgi:hypothetical protein
MVFAVATIKGGCCLKAAEIIRRKLKNANPASRKILLIAEILVGGDEQIEFRFCRAEELSIDQSSPATKLAVMHS